jgi:AhpD family alkylhydroperoxidase
MNITNQPSVPVAPSDPLNEGDPTFMATFDTLYAQTWGGDAIPAKYKELAGVALSIVGRCDACLAYHLRMCHEHQATRAEIIEMIRLAILSGGSITIPTARYAYTVMRDLGIE